MNQTEQLDHAKVYSLLRALLTIMGFLLLSGVLIIFLSTWVAVWAYIIIAAIAVTSFVIGHIAGRDLIDLGVYKHSNFYQGDALPGAFLREIALDG